MKKILQSFFFLVIISSFSSCAVIAELLGTGGSDQKEPTKESTTTQEQTTTNSNTPVDLKSIGRVIWEMEDYFKDWNGNKLVDLPNTYDYANPRDGYKVFFKVVFWEDDFKEKLKSHLKNKNLDDIVRNQVSFSYNITEKSNNKQIVNCIQNCTKLSYNSGNPMQEFEKSLPNGDYVLNFRIETSINNRKYYTVLNEEFTVKNILIVAMGDSYSSGEGNPDYVSGNTIVWADDNGSGKSKDHCSAHRSTTVWSAQGARMLERSSKQTSVTYINCAASGGQISHIIDKPYVKKNKCPQTLPPQIEEVKKIIGNRSIDALCISVGGNDVGFAQIIMATKLRDNSGLSPITNDDIRGGIKGGNWTSPPFRAYEIKGFDIDFFDTPGLNNLGRLYDALAINIEDRLPNTKKVYFMQYPSPASGCKEIFPENPSKYLKWINKILSIDTEIGGNEMELIKEEVVTPVNKLIAQKCNQYKSKGWTLMSNIPQLFWGHGYCVKDVGYKKDEYTGIYNHYPNAAINDRANDKRYFRTYEYSNAIQKDPNGICHPNEIGHRVIAGSFLNYLNRDIFSKNNIKILNKPFEGGNRLFPYQRLKKGQFLTSSNNIHRLEFRSDGNLVLTSGGQVKWQSKTANKGVKCVMQGDSNFVIYDKNNKAIWSSGTWRVYYEGAAVLLNEKGNIYITSPLRHFPYNGALKKIN